jgi:glucose-1-phosphate adenylyltransferase
MSKNPKILSIVLAGGEGTRLMPLTRDRAKPAVPFGGVFRLIDFPLSNLVNSAYRQIVVLTQYKSHSLDRHISQMWRFSPMLGSYVSPVPAQQRLGKHWYLGSADAIYQTINIIEDVRPDIVVILGADHVYRMDFEQMVQQHIDSGAEFTVAGIRQPATDAKQFGVIDVDPDHPDMIRSFQEKPDNPSVMPDDPSTILASMGNYVANTKALFEALALDEKASDTKHDMGGDMRHSLLGDMKLASMISTRMTYLAQIPKIMHIGEMWEPSNSSTTHTWISLPTYQNLISTTHNGLFTPTSVHCLLRSSFTQDKTGLATLLIQ